MQDLLDLHFAEFWKWCACYKVRDRGESFSDLGFFASASLMAGLVLPIRTRIHGIGSRFRNSGIVANGDIGVANDLVAESLSYLW